MNGRCLGSMDPDTVNVHWNVNYIVVVHAAEPPIVKSRKARMEMRVEICFVVVMLIFIIFVVGSIFAVVIVASFVIVFIVIIIIVVFIASILLMMVPSM
jgi:hypothetical protein